MRTRYQFLLLSNGRFCPSPCPPPPPPLYIHTSQRNDKGEVETPSKAGARRPQGHRIAREDPRAPGAKLGFASTETTATPRCVWRLITRFHPARGHRGSRVMPPVRAWDHYSSVGINKPSFRRLVLNLCYSRSRAFAAAAVVTVCAAGKDARFLQTTNDLYCVSAEV